MGILMGLSLYQNFQFSWIISSSSIKQYIQRHLETEENL